MVLDKPTLFAGLMTAELAGSLTLVLFLLLWKQRSTRCTQSVTLWSVGMFLVSIGTLLIALRGTVSDQLSIVLANALVILGVGIRSCGFARFLGLPVPKWGFVCVAGLWMVLCLYPPFVGSLLARGNFVQTCLALTAFWVVWMAFFKNREKLVTVRLLGLTSLIDGLVCFLFTVQQNIASDATIVSAFSRPFLSGYIMVLLFSMIVTIVLAACMVVERSFARYREQALQDTLTGLPNRRGFLNTAEGQVSDRTSVSDPYHVIIFAIDRFQCISDRYGNAMGDAILHLFTRVLKDTLAPGTNSGRVGGVIFAVLIEGENQEFATLTAQRICRRFGSECRDAAGDKLTVTVSAGVVTSDAGARLDRSMEVAECALLKARKLDNGQIVNMDLALNGRASISERPSSFSPMRRSAA